MAKADRIMLPYPGTEGQTSSFPGPLSRSGEKSQALAERIRRARAAQLGLRGEAASESGPYVARGRSFLLNVRKDATPRKRLTSFDLFVRP